MWCSVSLFNFVVSISISRFFQSGFSLISGIISSLLCSNCSSPFQERKKIKGGGTSYRINFCLDFCLSVPADWIIFYYYYCYVTEFASCVNLKPLLIRLWLITYLKKTKLVCCALSGRLCSRKCIKWFLFNCEQTFLLSFQFLPHMGRIISPFEHIELFREKLKRRRRNQHYFCSVIFGSRWTEVDWVYNRCLTISDDIMVPLWRGVNAVITFYWHV